MGFLADDVLAKAAYHSLFGPRKQHPLLYNPDKCIASGQPTSLLPSGSLAFFLLYLMTRWSKEYSCKWIQKLFSFILKTELTALNSHLSRIPKSKTDGHLHAARRQILILVLQEALLAC
jgi:hypothetical protein